VAGAIAVVDQQAAGGPSFDAAKPFTTPFRSPPGRPRSCPAQCSPSTSTPTTPRRRSGASAVRNRGDWWSRS